MSKYGFSCLILFAKTQRLHGITSLLPNGKHIILADLENCTLEQAKRSLLKVPISYSLSNIYITSDAENSYRAWCFSEVDFDTLNEILLKIKKDGCLDPIFFDYTNRRKKATLGDSKKKDRPRQKIVSILKSYPLPFPEHVREVFYTTGIVKRGVTISLGEGGEVNGLF